MLTVAISKRNKLQNIIVLTPKDGNRRGARGCVQSHSLFLKKMIDKPVFL